jgi:hypothetical protein
MSHNLHLIRVTADTPQEACEEVESYIEDWGTENNWRTICGCVSEHDEVYDNPDETFGGRYKPTACGYTTIGKINKAVRGWLKPDFYHETAIKKLAKGQTNLKKWTTSDLYSLRKLAEYHTQLKYLGKAPSKFNVLTDEFYAYEYAECGVTNCENGNGETTYIVFVDMHD